MKEKLIDKIRKLLSLAGNNPNVEEAAAAAAKAQSLMLEHKLSIEEIPDEEKREECGKEDTNLGGNARSIMWRRVLYECIAKHHFCTTVYTANTKVSHIVGKPSHIAVTNYLYAYLAGEIERLYKDYLRRGAFLLNPNLRAFAFGAIRSIREKFEAERRAAQTQAGPACQALVLTEDRSTRLALARFFPRLSSKATISLSSSDAYGAGLDAGRGIGLRRGVGHTGGTLLG